MARWEPYGKAPTVWDVYTALSHDERDEVAKKITDFTNKAHIEALIKRFDWTTKWENDRRAARIKAGYEDDTVAFSAGNEHVRVRTTGRSRGRILGPLVNKGSGRKSD